MNLVLVPMSGPDFERRAAMLRRRYAGNLEREKGLAPADAEAEARRQMEVVLPRGLDSDLSVLRSAQVDGVQVGWLWAMLPGAPTRPEMAWLHNIDVDPEHQGRGHGRAMILALEAELRDLGVSRLGLNVFGGNKRAIALYESLGFTVMAQQMAKPLDTTPVAEPEPTVAPTAVDDADQVPDPQYVAGLTRVRVAAGVLYRDGQGRVLVVQPTYKDTAEIPGGALEAGESPLQACRREVREELGIDLPVGGLLGVDWTPPRPHWDGALTFVFDGGELTDAQTEAIRAAPDELSGWRFVAVADLDALMVPRLAQRIRTCLARVSAGTYLESGDVPTP
ncbi:GNAT family N-acetyltransferase [Catellatospora sp. NPDC049133]|jgi:ribosomal protein S18 acetylase RimI-like enzyme/8-oxo-dGTP pyrophosphatase MutT (NUDIX family)|uniref:GNAT family N-acetyltransferase n=1 Tax=Catellatospora sp. NPDC049133 TaxID=3155499 RepID=UPI0033CB8E9E